MIHLDLRSIALVALTAAFVPLGSACYVDEAPPPEYAEGYQPQFYDGRVVYYDDGGRPYYYNGGAVVWVPVGSPYYVGLVNHWHAYGPAYHRWYGHYGARYRGYHRR